MRKSIVAILVSVFLLSTAFCTELFSSVTANTSCTLNSNSNSNVIARYGKAYLENVSGLLVLHVKGSPYEMGYQNGFLLKDYLNLTRLQDHLNRSDYEYWLSVSQNMEPYIPQEYIEEMHGLADGLNVNYTDILVMHVIDVRCSGFAVFGNATIDGHLYHGRNEDWSLPPEGQDWGLVTVHEPENGNAFVNVGHIFVIGMLSGMNKEGISLGVKISGTSDHTLDGMPIYFLLRKVIQYSNNLSQAIGIINQTDRTTGWNIVLGDGKNFNACAVEISDNYCKVFWAGDPAEDIPPHYSIENAVRRTNHYIDPELRATQSSTYDPTGSSWNRYEKLSQLILDNYGNISAEMSIQFLKTHPIAAVTLQSVVFDSTDLELWVANARGGTPAYQREYVYLSSNDLFSEHPAVGGLWIPVDKFSLLAPYIALVSTIILAVSVSVAYIKYRKKQ